MRLHLETAQKKILSIKNQLNSANLLLINKVEENNQLKMKVEEQ